MAAAAPPTLVAASRAGVGLVVLHVEMEGVTVVFDAIDDPGRKEEGGVRQRNQRQRFQLWQKASLTERELLLLADVRRREETRGEEPRRPPEISAAAVTRSWGSG